MVSYANSVLDDGLNLPFPENVIKFMKNENIKMYDQYLMIDGEFDYNATLALNQTTVSKRRILRNFDQPDV